MAGMGKRCLWTHQACHMILLWICSEICLKMGIFSAISIGQIIYRKHRLGADNTLYCKSVYAWTLIGESRILRKYMDYFKSIGKQQTPRT
mgnify:FL=1